MWPVFRTFSVKKSDLQSRTRGTGEVLFSTYHCVSRVTYSHQNSIACGRHHHLECVRPHEHSLLVYWWLFNSLNSVSDYIKGFRSFTGPRSSCVKTANMFWFTAACRKWTLHPRRDGVWVPDSVASSCLHQTSGLSVANRPCEGEDGLSKLFSIAISCIDCFSCSLLFSHWAWQLIETGTWS